jgi:hypothetical protein
MQEIFDLNFLFCWVMGYKLDTYHRIKIDINSSIIPEERNVIIYCIVLLSVGHFDARQSRVKFQP